MGHHALLVDRFDRPAAPGAVIGTRSTSGMERLGADREGTIGIDNGLLRMGWLAHEGWGRSTLAYGPFDEPSGLMLVVRALNCLTTSQSDPRPEGGRAKLRRLRATAPHASLRQPTIRDSLTIGWFDRPQTNRPPRPIAAVSHRAGDDATGELWFQVGSNRVRLARDLQNLPATYIVGLTDEHAVLHAWSYPGATGFASPGELTPLARLELEAPLPSPVFAAIHQPVLGEVSYRVDTRIESVEVLRPAQASQLIAARSERRWWEPVAGPRVIADGFDGEASDLAGAPTVDGGPCWERVMGDGVIERSGAGLARVRATLEAPNPGRTAYCVPWSDPSGVEVSSDVIPPGRARGEGHQGRSGLIIWQDVDNHLVLNHFIDDGSVGVSISAFLRTGGREAMFEWDAVWSNVAERVQWGRPFRLTVSCDGHQFLCRIGDEPVLYRRIVDYRADARPLRITGVGLVANWEWGDDTGTSFDDFSVAPLTSIDRAGEPCPRADRAEPSGR